jgi:Tfp pilus assembly protein PilF
MAEGNDDTALELLSNADASNPMTAYYQAIIYEKKGDKAKASESYKKLEEWTDNSINLAFVRNKIKNK